MWRKTFSLSLPTLVLAALSIILSVAGDARPRSLPGSRHLIAGSTKTASIAPGQRRSVTLRHSSTADGTRLTFTADQLLDDYDTYVEEDRFYVLIPQANLIGAKNAPTGRGFADIRIEQRGDDVVLSFILKQGATVNFNQKLNRLDVVFMTNEKANKAPSNSLSDDHPHLDDFEI